jgi:hypothetical protein
MLKRQTIRDRRHASPVWRELTLQQMMDDPIVHDLMRSDRVSRADIESLFGALRRTALRAAA